MINYKNWLEYKKQLIEEWELDLKSGGPAGRDVFYLISYIEKLYEKYKVKTTEKYDDELKDIKGPLKGVLES